MPDITDPTSRLLATRIRTARTERGLTLVDLATRITDAGMPGTNLTGPLIGRIENRARAVSVPELNALANALGTTPSDLTREGDICGSCGQEITR